MTLPLPHLYSGKVRDIYAVGDDQLLMVTSDRLSAFDVVLDEPILHKGRVLTAISAFWFEALGDVAPAPPRVHRRRRPARWGPRRGRRPGRPDHAVPQGRDAGDRVHRAWLPVRVGLEGVQAAARCTASAARRPAGERRAARAGVHAVDQGDEVHDENISFEAAVDLVGRRLATGPATSPSSCTAAVPRWPASAGSSSPTPSSSWASSTASWCSATR